MNAEPKKTVLILGATSAVAIAFARQACAAGSVRVVLVGRDAARLEEVLADMKARGADASSFSMAAELGNPDAVAGLCETLVQRAERFDDVLLAYGVLGDQAAQQSSAEEIRSLMDVNFVSAVIWCEQIAAIFERQGHGRLGVIGSVAGDRGRQSNYLYGATKAGLERVCEGMAHRFAASKNISVTLVKPGFIDTPMTAHIEKGGPLWATPDQVAAVTLKAMQARRVRVYAPWFWRWILLIVRSLPVPVMHKTKM
jgi:decaprenylphospho-beta-D-erythro-pentofuranosid-2-ulose 2-reductase